MSGRNSSTEEAKMTMESLESPSLTWALICTALYSTSFTYGLVITITAGIQGSVIEEFSDVASLGWIAVGFSLGSVIAILPYGAFYRTFNMKWGYISGLAIFLIGTVLCGIAPTMEAFIVGRVLAGVGGSGIYLGALSYLAALTTDRTRGIYLNELSAAWAIGGIMGPLVGGGLSVSMTWRWGFYLIIIIGGITSLISLFFLPQTHLMTGKLVCECALSLDYVGFGIYIGIWVAFTLGFMSGGRVWPWNDGRTIASIAMLLLLLIIYSLQQYFCLFTSPKNRSFPGHLLRSCDQSLLNIATGCSNTAMLTTFYLSIYFEFTRNETPFKVGLRVLPFLCTYIVTSFIACLLVHIINRHMPIYCVSGFLMVVASACFTLFLSPSTSTGGITGISIVIAVGSGLTSQLGYTVASLKASTREDKLNAVNLQNLSQMSSTVICQVIASQIFQSIAARNLARVLAPMGFSHVDIQDAVVGTQSRVFQSLSGVEREQAVWAITEGMKRPFYIVLVGGGVGLAAALCMNWKRLYR
ncbi:MFS general substrate transporter [Aspergillus heteromorphus CBS 117.55]|uniref:MFS general substrate transporter n=1 Tax=Aspergillus heteromorphus CBS 117.55 TaxID=1448321 RepID=A0A317X0T4_9EURO|nr:MFS general substrate transporter [Aspergillus heteromorphus CBS 117.55]PWY92206.1 MFS general substrate transporter [Aspergillus heteromorphus CBS 117.55]